MSSCQARGNWSKLKKKKKVIQSFWGVRGVVAISEGPVNMMITKIMILIL